MRLNACVFLAILCPLASSAEKLTVGTKIAPPFVIEKNGELSGISIDLWKNLANELRVEYEFQKRDLDGLMKGLEDGSLDVAVAAMTTTPNREEVIDFTQPFDVTGTGIAVRQESGAIGLFKKFLTVSSLKALGILLLVIGVPAFFFWVCEAKGNPQVGYGPKGLANSYWWSAVTMTTVGYGDIAPQTTGGRIVAGIWMYISVMTIASLTGALGAALYSEVSSMDISSAKDLAKVEVATVRNSASEEQLSSKGITYRSYDDLESSLDALVDKEVDAVVYDIPILKYHIKGSQDVTILPYMLMRQDYAIALPQGSTLREPLNRALLREIASSRWKKITNKYLEQ